MSRGTLPSPRARAAGSLLAVRPGGGHGPPQDRRGARALRHPSRLPIAECAVYSLAAGRAGGRPSLRPARGPLRAALLTAALVGPPAAGVPAQDGAPPPDVPGSRTSEEIEALRRRVAELERRLAPSDSGAGGLDLSGQELPYLDEAPDAHPLALPWFRKVDLWGFGAAGFLDTGRSGTRPDGGFLVKEASLFVEATAWEGWSFFYELQTNRLGQDERLFVRTGEVHAHARDLIELGKGATVSAKVGRFDIPFGEEYLWQDASDNPLITNSAAYPYGFDEGILLYGTWAGVGWVAAVTDGTDGRSLEDDPAKALNAKVSGRPWAPLYLSASVMKNGAAAKSAFEWGGSHAEPVGAGGAPSAAGASPSDKVDALLYELDAMVTLSPRAALDLVAGAASIEDDAAAFARDFAWFSLQPRYDLSRELYLVARYSEIGTYDSDQGYHFDGKTVAGGNSSFGYDTERLQRVSVGLGWKPNPNTTLKLELGRDAFDVIDASAFDPRDDDRDFLGLELVLSF